MKKFLLMFICFIVIGGGVCGADITRGHDTFHDAITINSWMKNDSRYKYILFKKIVSKEYSTYLIRIDNSGIESVLISNRPAEIKIGDEVPYKLECDNYDQDIIAHQKHVIVRYIVPNEIVERMRNADRIALRFYTNNGSYLVCVLPNDVLSEWKEVITTEK